MARDISDDEALTNLAKISHTQINLKLIYSTFLQKLLSSALIVMLLKQVLIYLKHICVFMSDSNVIF